MKPEVKEIVDELFADIRALSDRAEVAESERDEAMRVLSRLLPYINVEGMTYADLQQLELARKMLGIEEEACHYCERPKWHESDCPVLLDQVAERMPIG